MPLKINQPIPQRLDIDRVVAVWHDKEAPGMAVVGMQNDKLVHAKGYGLASVKDSKPITLETVFDLASVSKQFTAMAITILAERGVLKVTDPLSKFFPQFPAYAKEITIRHLLDHTSGLPDYMEILEKSGRLKDKEKPYEPSSSDVVELLSQQKTLLFSPGEKFEYSNSAYTVLGQIVGRASGTPFPKFVKDNIFQPLEMRSSSVLDESRPVIANRAISYSYDGKTYTDSDYSPLNWIYGDGGVQTTSLDMARWIFGLSKNQLVTDATIKQAFTSTKLNDGTATGYGYGWYVGKALGMDQVAHTGSWAGFRNAVRFFPANGVAIVVLTNTDRYDFFSRSYLTLRMARLLLGRGMKIPPSVPVNPDHAKKLAGKYQMEDNISIEIIARGDDLWLKYQNLPEIRMMPVTDYKFVLRDAEAEVFEFDKDSNGNITSVTQICSLYGDSKSAISKGKKLS